MAKRSKIIGMRELEKMFKKLGEVPQRTATKSARAGATIARRAAKNYAPEEDGDLKKGIILKKERKSKPGKAVYDIMMSPHMNDVFVKVSKEGKRSYYPASQEYGFLTADGGYIPGHRFLKRSIEDHDTEIERKILDTAKKDVEKALRG